MVHSLLPLAGLSSSTETRRNADEETLAIRHDDHRWEGSAMTIPSPYEVGRQPCRGFRPMSGRDPEPCPREKCEKHVQRCQGCLDLHHEGGREYCPGEWR